VHAELVEIHRNSVLVDEFAVGVADEVERQRELVAELVERERRVDADAVQPSAGVGYRVETVLEGAHLVAADTRERAGEKRQHERAVSEFLRECERVDAAVCERCSELRCVVSVRYHTGCSGQAIKTVVEPVGFGTPGDSPIASRALAWSRQTPGQSRRSESGRSVCPTRSLAHRPFCRRSPTCSGSPASSTAVCTRSISYATRCSVTDSASRSTTA